MQAIKCVVVGDGWVNPWKPVHFTLGFSMTFLAPCTVYRGIICGIQDGIDTWLFYLGFAIHFSRITIRFGIVFGIYFNVCVAQFGVASTIRPKTRLNLQSCASFNLFNKALPSQFNMITLYFYSIVPLVKHVYLSVILQTLFPASTSQLCKYMN